MELQLDHLIPEAYRITQESGLVIGEQVRHYDSVTKRPAVDGTDYYVESIEGETATTVCFVETGSGVVRLTVKSSDLFATSPLLELFNNVAAKDSISLRKSNIDGHHDHIFVEFVTEQQLNALSRACALIKKKKMSASYEEIFIRLALAEQKSEFLCGFCSLAAAKTYREQLKQLAVDRGVISVDSNDQVTLMPEGERRSTIELPPQIEELF